MAIGKDVYSSFRQFKAFADVADAGGVTTVGGTVAASSIALRSVWRAFRHRMSMQRSGGA